MIKINLLNSVTERQAGAIDVVDQKIGSAGSRLLILALVVGFLTTAVVGWDVLSTQMAKAAAQKELDAQKQREAELQSVINEQKDLEAKISAIDARIDAIKKLRANQAGPSAVLEAMRERVGMLSGLYLESVEQKGDNLEFKGSSPDESQVTQFGRSLEFSNGLFSNLNIETKREEVQNQQATAVPTSTNPDAGKIGIVKFTIKCAYTPSKAASPNAALPPANGAAQPSQPAAK
ncbi:MAG TPA: PilN domain-containing protein [Pyrinomonadaceae bacterium]|jgi:Tfp pilus assembly protein PilN|nr:PilN domain-containing protein [Pyrinomonadaceae bacterium]